jgi:hypothetical protein
MPAKAHKQQGLFKPAPTMGDPPERVADFSYQNDALAELIVKAWTEPPFRNQLVNGTPAVRMNNARTVLAARGINLTNPIVLTETEFNEGWDRDVVDQVVFVLPDPSRATMTAGTPLLETAKLLMACTPNGI